MNRESCCNSISWPGCFQFRLAEHFKRFDLISICLGFNDKIDLKICVIICLMSGGFG